MIPTHARVKCCHPACKSAVLSGSILLRLTVEVRRGKQHPNRAYCKYLQPLNSHTNVLPHKHCTVQPLFLLCPVHWDPSAITPSYGAGWSPPHVARGATWGPRISSEFVVPWAPVTAWTTITTLPPPPWTGAQIIKSKDGSFGSEQEAEVLPSCTFWYIGTLWAAVLAGRVFLGKGVHRSRRHSKPAKWICSPHHFLKSRTRYLWVCQVAQVGLEPVATPAAVQMNWVNYWPCGGVETRTLNSLLPEAFCIPLATRRSHEHTLSMQTASQYALVEKKSVLKQKQCQHWAQRWGGGGDGHPHPFCLLPLDSPETWLSFNKENEIPRSFVWERGA